MQLLNYIRHTLQRTQRRRALRDQIRNTEADIRITIDGAPEGDLFRERRLKALTQRLASLQMQLRQDYPAPMPALGHIHTSALGQVHLPRSLRKIRGL